MERLDKLVDDYADSEKSDTFAAYNDAIRLAKAVRRLRKQLASLEEEVENLRCEIADANSR